MHFQSKMRLSDKYVFKKADLFYFQNVWILQLKLNCIPTMTSFSFGIDSVLVYLHCFNKENNNLRQSLYE